GPNTAYFDHKYSLAQMVDHIYGRRDLLAGKDRPHMFINELSLYIEHLRKYVRMNHEKLDNKKEKYINNFKNQLEQGIAYYADLKELHVRMAPNELTKFFEQLRSSAQQLRMIQTNLVVV